MHISNPESHLDQERRSRAVKADISEIKLHQRGELPLILLLVYKMTAKPFRSRVSRYRELAVSSQLQSVSKRSFPKAGRWDWTVAARVEAI